MRPDLLALPDAGVAGRVAGLRVELAHHPVHQWTVSRSDRGVLLTHVAFTQWAGAALAATLGLCGPQRQFDTTLRALRRRGLGAVLGSFGAEVAKGTDPAVALADAGGPVGAGPLVTLAGHLVARGSRAARAGALVLGLPDCVIDGPPAGGLAAGEQPCGPGGPEAARAAEDAATAVLVAELTLLDGALEVIRHHHMVAHPATQYRQHQARPQLRLLPA
jgi:hypothetical protein